ncbi:MAG: transposase [Fimbriimonadaceae bacterium]|nr:transposase [Chitinophagales bacterium]
MALRGREKLKEYNCFFITTTCTEHLHLLPIGESYKIIYDNFDHYNKKYLADILGYVLMPNHFHFLIYFKQQNRLSDYLRDFKKYTSYQIRVEVEKNKPEIIEKLIFIRNKQKLKVWADRFYDEHIYTTAFLEQKLNYMHKNPLQEHWKLADKIEDYEHSSASYYINEIQRHQSVTHYLNYFDPIIV